MWRRRGLLVFVVACLLLAALGAVSALWTPGQSCTPPTPDPALGTVDGVYVLPFDGRDPVLDEIDAASCTIDINMYLLSDDATIEALLRAETRGVEVRLIYEEAPFGGGVGIVDMTENLANHGVDVRPGPDGLRFMHAKYIVVDGHIAIITNQNLTYSAFESNREFGVVTNDRHDVEALAAVFEADWNRTEPPDPSGRLIVSPQRAREALLERINAAETSIRLYVEVIRDDEMIDALSTAAQRGVSVRLIVNPADDDLDPIVYDTLASNGVEVRVASRVYIHAKAMVVDDRIVVIGSHNLTSTSLNQNREVSIVLDDGVAIARTATTFDADWEAARPWISATHDLRNWSSQGVDMTVLYG